jgi:hypothetical protein
MNDPRAFKRGMMAGILLMIGSHAVNWFISHPGASTNRALMVGLQLVIGLGGGAWLILQQRRGAVASHA